MTRVRMFALGLTALFCLGLLACTEVLFSRKAKGRNPIELVGEYYFSFAEGARNEASGLVEIKNLRANQYAFIVAGEEVHEVEIVARGNEYYINRPDSTYDGYWRIATFRIQGDSAYNLVSALGEPGLQEDELDIEASFKRYRMEELQDGDSLYFIDNRGRELYRAFRALNDVAVSKKDGVLLKRLSEPDSDESGFAERLTSTSKIGPNPFLDVLSLQFFEEIPGEVRLLSIDGKLIRKTIPTAPQIDWPLTDLEAGIYLLQWVDPSSNKLETYKVVKQ